MALALQTQRRRNNLTFVTSMGEVELELYWDHAPKTCENFLTLGQRGYYDNVLFHRIIRGFMIQGGDPSGTGRGGESIYDAADAGGPAWNRPSGAGQVLKKGKFVDEIHPQLYHSGAGVLSMANSGPNTNGSQFFITLKPCPHLDGKHAIFGRVKRGMGVVERLGNVPVTQQKKPVDQVKILRAYAS